MPDVQMSENVAPNAAADSENNKLHLLKEAETPKFKARNLHLRKIIKENHLKTIVSADMNCHHLDDDRRHMVVTTGHNQINIYDNNHCGNHIDLACHFINKKTEFSYGGESSIVKFLYCEDDVNEALIAFGGIKKEISIMSVAHTRIVRLLKGHESEIIDIAPHKKKPGCFFSASRDNTIRFWNATDDNAQQVFDAGKGLECIASHPTEGVVMAGYKDGSVKRFTLGSGQAFELYGPKTLSRIDCIEYIDSERILVYTATGVLQVINATTGEAMNKIKVPRGNVNNNNKKMQAFPTKFGISDCREMVCCGNSTGEVFIFDINTSSRLNKLSMPRIRGAVTKSMFTKQSSSVIVTTDDAIIWRWDYKHPQHKSTKKLIM